MATIYEVDVREFNAPRAWDLVEANMEQVLGAVVREIEAPTMANFVEAEAHLMVAGKGVEDIFDSAATAKGEQEVARRWIWKGAVAILI